MKCIAKLTALPLLFLVFDAHATAPVRGCRVKSETFQQHGLKMNNAGCILTRGQGEETEILVVFTGATTPSGTPLWEFPAGTPSSKEADGRVINNKAVSTQTKKIAEQFSFEYVEPAVCTASREAYEETGHEVVVGDLLYQSEKFLAFRCYFAQPGVAQKKFTLKDVVDKGEVKAIRWVKKNEALNPAFWHYPNNLEVVTPLFSK